jgi:uncharacterized protein (TIGR03089 family)
VLLGAWSAGLRVDAAATTDRGPAPAAGPDGEVDVVFAALDRLADAPPAGDRFVLGLAPMGLPLREVPAGWLDYIAEVRGHGDQFRTATPAAGTGYRDALTAAREAAAALGLRPGDRVLVDAAAVPDHAGWLLGPLAVGASLVLCANLDPAAVPSRVTTERVTRHL